MRTLDGVGAGLEGAGFEAGACGDSSEGGIDIIGSGEGAGRTFGADLGAGKVAGGAPIVVERGGLRDSGVGRSGARLAQPHTGTQLASTIVTASMVCGIGPSYRNEDLIRRFSEKGERRDSPGIRGDDGVPLAVLQ